MGRAPCCEKVGLKRGRWTTEEDEILINYINQNGEGSWRSLPKNAGLLRCGKSCRLRWINYLRADLKRGNFSVEEDETVIKLHRSVGNRWSLIAGQLPGRTDNEIKNYWNSHLRRKIYSFRSGKGSLLNTVDVRKMSSSTCKRRGGRVCPSVAKKYNKAMRHNTVNGTQENRARNATHEAGENLEVGPTREEVEVESRVNSNSSTIHDSCREGKEVIWQDSIFGSLNELGGGGDIEVVEELLIDGPGFVDQFFPSELSDLCKISINDEEKLKGSWVPEREYEAWHSSLDSGLLEECFSPLSSSYYIDDMAKFGTTIDASIGFGGLWD